MMYVLLAVNMKCNPSGCNLPLCDRCFYLVMAEGLAGPVTAVFQQTASI